MSALPSRGQQRGYLGLCRQCAAFEQIAEIGTPVNYVMAWLDHAAESAKWKKIEFEARQLNLF